MAKYYAIMRGDYLQQDFSTGQLEIYETKKQAEKNSFSILSVVAVEVKKFNVSSALALEKRIQDLETAIRETLDENKHLADGEICTLAKLKSVLDKE